ncbi:MAG: aminotransferase class I/II-fold pyridoxal phosphate-dependent enzyme [Holophagales bacterium]|nr:aminotransferase class I/II-fold pyridoxal phosphate-dependent enzyme [Holophagales bacterium]
MSKSILRSEPFDLDSRSPGDGAGSAATLAVHAGREDFRLLGVHAPPLDLSTTYPVVGVEEAAASLDAMAAGGRPLAGQAVYSRLHNPTVDRFEVALARLEGARLDGTVEAVAFASGMAAVTACLLAARLVSGTAPSGVPSHVVAVRPLYGGTDHLLASGLLGGEVSWATPETVAEAIRPSTVLVVVETPANPTLDLVDIAAVVERAGEVPVLVDSTFATPTLQRPLEHGAVLSLHSATKFLGGHGDVLAGAVATSDPSWAAALRQVRILTGAVLHPLAAYLLHRGLATLPVRIAAAQRGARALARRLAVHPAVAGVRYPGLPGGDPEGLVGRQMAGPGTMITLEVAGGFEAASSVITALELITPAVSLGSTDTLIQHPAAMTHRVVSEEGRRAGGITPAMLRLSVGLEHPDDLWADLCQALDRASAGHGGDSPTPAVTSTAAGG